MDEDEDEMDEDEDDDDTWVWVDPNCHKCDSPLRWFDRDTWLCPLCDFTDEDDD